MGKKFKKFLEFVVDKIWTINLTTFATVALGAFLLVPIDLYVFPLMDTKFETLAIGLALAISGSIAEWRGYAPRFLKIPIWLYGMGVSLIGLFPAWSWAGILIPTGGVLGLAVLILLILYIQETLAWNRARALPKNSEGERPG